jgi:hypothetical protein
MARKIAWIKPAGILFMGQFQKVVYEVNDVAELQHRVEDGRN